MSLRTVLERLALYSVASMLFIDAMIKLFPKLIPERTAVLDRRFDEYSVVCITSMFGYMPNPFIYKICVGSWEICSAIGLLFKDIRQMACIILGIIMVGAIHTYINLKEYSETVFPAIVFLTLCYIYGMTNRTSVSENTETEKEKED
ncbi:transmembrane protein 35B-like [Mytilus trossulus]|uniref:transmembrane protein 35B-like n=1 Tax=Mytilus trossulus TaxID=6551 RepID=UPI00300591F3